MGRNILKNFFKLNKQLFFYWLFLIVVNLLVINLPLVGVLGYEFSAVIGLILTFLGGYITISLYSRAEFDFLKLISILLSFFLIPLFIIIIKSILTGFCSFTDGIIFYLLISGTSLLFGSAIALLISFAVKKLRRVIFTFVLFLIALIPIAEIYFNPQVYFYSPLIGFFPGNIYDEALSPDWQLLIHQLFVTIYAGLIFTAILKFQSIAAKFRYYFIVVIIFVAILFQYLSPLLNFSTSFATIDTLLSKKIDTKKFCLHFDKAKDIESKYIFLSTLFYLKEIEQKLNVKPTRKIDIYIFNNNVQKKKYFGAGNADVAKPWQYCVYTSLDSWDRTLKHEIIHVFSAEFGNGIFKLAGNFNPALIEGMAEAIDEQVDDFNLMDVTALAYQNNYKINLSELFGGMNFFKSNSTLSYAVSGAFIKYCIEKFGIEKVKQFYKTNDFNLAFDENIEKIHEDFESYLKGLAPIGSKTMSDFYFGRVSIIKKVCPRFISDRIQKGFKMLAEKNYSEAEKYFTEVNEKAINYASVLGLSEVYFNQNKKVKAIKLVKQSVNRFQHTPYYFYLQLRLADLLALDDQIDSARYYYTNLTSEVANYSLYFNVKTRLALLGKGLCEEYINVKDSIKYYTLLKLNEENYEYNSLPALIDLSLALNKNYTKVKKSLNKTFIVDDIESSYAAFKLSEYMMLKGDYINARKYAALCLRYREYNPFYFVMQQNFAKANWFYFNAVKELSKMKLN